MTKENSARLTWKLVLAYDGTDFHGWQVQPGLITIQGELRSAIERITGEDVLPQGSGRTDAGVHAERQVASFSLHAPIPEANFVRALNRALPAAVRVLSAEHAPPGFHARHVAKAKTYEYRIFRGEICPPWMARYVYVINYPLDLSAMQQAAVRFLGEHDFTSFAASDPDLAQRGAVQSEDPSGNCQDNLRTISASEWIQPSSALPNQSEILAGHPDRPSLNAWPFDLSGDLLIYRVRGNGFLHHMVRNLVGTMIEVGRENLRQDEIPAIFAARARSSAGPTAPARGLFLVGVEY